jgi:hypothetical protein
MFLFRNNKNGVAGISDIIEWLLWIGILALVGLGIWRIVAGAAG